MRPYHSIVRALLRGALIVCVWILTALGARGDSNSTTVEFNRDIRPILSDKCYACHGPDKANRKTNLHFDTEDGAFTPLAGGGLAIIRGDAKKSVMYQRVASQDEAVRMPPAYMGRAKLSEGEINLIKRWLDQGAKWEKHWSVIPPKRPLLPEVKHKD